MKKLKTLFIALFSVLALTASAQTAYDFSLTGLDGKQVPLSQYQGKVLLVVNTATECGFTPQFEQLEAIYAELAGQGLEILNIPCNQFGGQAPGTDEEIAQFCMVNFGTKFPQFAKADVNGEQELPLYAWLKAQAPFVGFDADNRLTPLLERMFDEKMPGWRDTPDVKWNFTKFLIDRRGSVVARFEPTHDMNDVRARIAALLAQ